MFLSGLKLVSIAFSSCPILEIPEVMPKPQLQMEVQKAQEESPSDDVDINSAAVTILCIQRTLHHSPSKGVTVMVL